MPTNETDWVATETVWGDAAHEEIKNAFPGKLKSREVALCVWCYGRHPDITETEIEAIAQSDPVIMELRRQKKISAHGKRRAKSLLGLGAKKEAHVDPSLSDFEREILLDLRATAALLDAYKKAEARMRKAEAAFEVARAKLRAITPQSARNLAEFEPETRTLLDAEGLRDLDQQNLDQVDPVTAAPPPASQPMEPAPTSQPVEPKPTVTAEAVQLRPTTEQPGTETSGAGETVVSAPEDTNAVDFAINVLKKKVKLAPKTSMVDADDVSSFDDEDVLDEDYHAKMEDCTKDVIVFWPDDRESLFD